MALSKDPAELSPQSDEDQEDNELDENSQATLRFSSGQGTMRPWRALVEYGMMSRLAIFTRYTPICVKCCLALC